MPQLSLYLDDETMANLRADAAREGTSLSKYANKVISERSALRGWPKGYWDLFGSLDDGSFRAPAELDIALDRPRGW